MGSEIYCSVCGKEWEDDESMIGVSVVREVYKDGVSEEISGIEAKRYCEKCAQKQNFITIPLKALVDQLQTKEEVEASREEASELMERQLEEDEKEGK